MRFALIAQLLALVFVLQACGSVDSESSFKYQVLPDDFLAEATISDVRNEWIRVCIHGHDSPEDLLRAKAWTRKGLLIWLRTFAVLDTAVSSNLHFTCDAPDLDITFKYGFGTGVAHAGWTKIWSHRPFATWTHEFGHALVGLSDTYSSGRPGDCERRQPRSRMCWGGSGPRQDHMTSSTLWPDDIAGAQVAYQRVFTGLETPPWGDEIDLEAPVDIDAPWPGATNQLKDDIDF